MIHKIFSVRDLKAEAYLQPFFSANTNTATRAFQDACRQADSPFAKHPEDYMLFELGLFDDVSGEVESITPKALGIGTEFLASLSN